MTSSSVIAREGFAVPADVAYFNTANLAPLLDSVRAAGEMALERRAAPWTIAAEDWFSDVEALRAMVGSLFGEDDDEDGDGVALVPSTSYGFAVAARNLPLAPGAKILVLDQEYPSGVYTWRRHAARSAAEVLTVSRGEAETWTDAVLGAITEQVAVVSVPQVHWTDGAWIDLPTVAEAARAVGAALVIDASQSLGAVPCDVATVRPDFVVSVGYKWMLGPFGRSYLWVAPHHRDGEPLEENWIVRAEAQDFARLVDYRDEYQPGARRFDHGQRTQFELTPMAITAAAQLLSWGVENVARRLAATNETIIARVQELGLRPTSDSRGPHLLGLALPSGSQDRITDAMARGRCYAAVRGSALRIAPHLHVTDEDVDRLVDALQVALR
ncbi:MAG: aminotransferase class V-fold PLP-dependent enzyme [Pseudonocardiales bacterium]|nr:aminotransferase class V-fold PLP-dependent enzyme [Pseudonocardiales bacterium]